MPEKLEKNGSASAAQRRRNRWPGYSSGLLELSTQDFEKTSRKNFSKPTALQRVRFVLHTFSNACVTDDPERPPPEHQLY